MILEFRLDPRFRRTPFHLWDLEGLVALVALRTLLRPLVQLHLVVLGYHQVLGYQLDR